MTIDLMENMKKNINFLLKELLIKITYGAVLGLHKVAEVGLVPRS